MTSEDTGQRVGNRYVLRARLGSGGAGTVWRADDEVLQRPVAVKSVRVPDAVPDDERTAGRQRVLREAWAAARLNHPGAVTVFDVFDEDGCAYLVMELVQAPSLEGLVERDGPLDPARTAAIGLQLLDALEAAHGRGIVHRDVKPSNVLVPDAGPARLTDFGIATVAGDSRLTATGLVLGSPSFMAPEQARDGAGRAPADLWGLGATLYFTVEGVAPFERGQPIATVHAVLHDEPRPTERAGPLGPLLSALLDKDPARRSSTTDARQRLQAVTGGGATHAEPAGDERAGATRPVRQAPATASAGRPGAGPASPWWRRPAVAVAAVALLALAAVTGAAALLDDTPVGEPRTGGGPPAEAPAPTGEDPPAGAEEPPAAEVPPGTAPGGAPGDGSGVPDGWVAYTDDAGWAIAHPPGWDVVDRSATIVDFRDPDSPTYLRVDHTDSPPESAVTAWEELSASFAASRTNYTELRIEPVTFQGLDGALWECTYTEGGLDLRASNLGFGTDEFGHALNFQTAADEWDARQDVHDAFRRSFRPVAG